MLDIFAKVLEKDGELREIKAAMWELRHSDVLVGVPDDSVERHIKKEQQAGQKLPVQRSLVSNAELLYIHTHGSAVRGIPPRPVIEPAIRHEKESISACLRQAAEAALDGRREAVVPALKKAGMTGQNAARGWFTNPANGWAANAAKTIQHKKSSRPLVDTGQMRKAITYKVKRKGSR